VQDAWRRGQKLYLRGWVYDINDGLLKDLKVSIHKDDWPANQALGERI
jgi:carbonic anhydrase